MQTAYLEAVVNRRHRVLGRELHDFCLYDALALEATDNPLWTRSRRNREALQAAVLICSTDPQRFLRAEMAPRTPLEKFTRWLWQLRCARANAVLEFVAWDDYLADYCALPALTDPQGDGRELKGPWIQSLAAFVEMHSNASEDEIMRAPFGRLRWKAECIAERLGSSLCEILTEDDLALLEEQRAYRAAEEAAQQHGG